MRMKLFGSLAIFAVCTAIASAQSPTGNVQPTAKPPMAQAQPATTQPAGGKVVPPQAGRGVFKANSGTNPTKPAVGVPTPTVTLKPGEVPGIKFDTPIYDFGRVRAGTDVEHDYWFTNSGTGPLEILAVRPG